MANTWRITRNDGTTTDLVRPDLLCPYPWHIGLALMDPGASSPVEWYASGNVRSVNLQPLPTTGSVTYTLTPATGSPVVVRTDDPDGLSVYGDNYATISRPDTLGKGRFVILAVRWDHITSIIRS